MSNELKVLKWLAMKEVGQSSKFLAFSFLDLECEYAHPYDPDDINRCFQLIKEVPDIKNYLPEMAKKSETWRLLVENWNEIQNLFNEEVGDNWSKGKEAPKTYELMESIVTD